MSERLEDRRLLAGDFHNADFPADVNADNEVSIYDLLGVVTALRDGGPRPLAPAGEGEDGSASTSTSMFVDVNGDNFLSISDALGVIHVLRGEGEANAVDDSFTDPPMAGDPFVVTSNSSNNPLPVLANDSPQGALSITRVAPLAGNLQAGSSPTEFGGTVTIQGSGVGNTVVYTPGPDFFGQDRFRYEVEDTNDGSLDEAVVTVFVQPGQNDVFVRFTYQALDPVTLTPITNVEQGEMFVLRAFVQDTRDDFQPSEDRGVAAAALDVTYNSSLATLVNAQNNPHNFPKDFVFGPEYQALESVDQFVEAGGMGLIDEISAAQTAFESSNPFPEPLGPGPIRFFDATFRANALGTLTVQGDPADNPENQVVVLRPGQLDPVPPSAIDYGMLQINVIAPVGAVADMFTVVEDAPPQTLNVLANDTNINGTTPFVGQIIGLGPNNLSQITLPSGSTVSIATGGQSVTYTPAPDFNGMESFSYTIRDSSGAEDSAIVQITVTPVNDAPVAVDDQFGPFIANGPQQVLDVLNNDFDVDGDPLTITGVTQPNNGGTVAISADGLTLLYTPGDVPGETFTYTISDGVLSDTATVTTVIETFDQAVEVTFNLLDLNGNLLPAGAGGVTQLNLGQNFQVQVQIADLRPVDETELGLGIFSAFIDFVYTASVMDFVGPVTFGPNYNNTDFREFGNATIDGLIDEVGSPQTNLFAGPLGPGPFTLFTVTLEATQFGTGTITGNLADQPGHEIQLFDPPTIVSAGDVRFETETVIVVNPNAQTPTAVNDQYSMLGGTVLQVTTRAAGVLGNDLDPEGDATIQVAAGSVVNPSNGTLNINPNGTFTYTPNAGFFGTDTFRYRATDGGALSNEATVSITVGANAVDDQFSGAVGQIITGNVLANDAVPAGSTVTLVEPPDRGTLILNPNGTFSYTPQPGQAFIDTFRYQVAGRTATVTLNVGTVAGSVTGVVFTDENDNRALDNGERRLGGVTVTLRNNTTGATLTTRTAANGAYAFPVVPAGAYTVMAQQPAFMIDGWNIINGGATQASDNVVVNLTGASQRVDFGELGLRAEFVKPIDFYGMGDPNGFQIATDVGRGLGQEHWFSLLDGWGAFTKAEAAVSADGTHVTIRMTRNDGQVFQLNNINIETDPRVRTLGRLGAGIVIRFEGTPTSFMTNATPLADGEGEAPSYTAAVDQLFSDGWTG
jgi:hypothetical protein